MTQEKEAPKQGKEKARKAEQVHILLLEKGARISGCGYCPEQQSANFCKGVSTEGIFLVLQDTYSL